MPIYPTFSFPSIILFRLEYPLAFQQPTTTVLQIADSSRFLYFGLSYSYKGRQLILYSRSSIGRIVQNQSILTFDRDLRVDFSGHQLSERVCHFIHSGHQLCLRISLLGFISFSVSDTLYDVALRAYIQWT